MQSPTIFRHQERVGDRVRDGVTREELLRSPLGDVLLDCVAGALRVMDAERRLPALREDLVEGNPYGRERHL